MSASRTPSSRLAGESAVVVGASMAGLCAARVLAEHFGVVHVLDRDQLPSGPEPRGQVPQGRQPHLLLASGARLLEGWFPGLLAELYAAGAVEVDLVGDFYWHQDGGVARRPRSDLVGPSMSRPLLEHTVRSRLAALPNVEISSAASVKGLVTDAAAIRVTGVRLDGDAVLDCDLLVDATGRAARTLPWVESLGYKPPPISQVEVSTRYASQIYRRDERGLDDWKAAAIIDEVDRQRLAMALPIEGDRWIIMFGGLHGEAAPTERGELLRYAASYPSAVISDLVASSDPLTEPVTHRFPSSQRRHVERLRRFPLGWLLLGDAVASFNPIYGQGMTSAAQQAAMLDKCLRRRPAVDRKLTRRYFKAVARIVNAPWTIAVGSDFAYAATTGPKPPGTDLINRYMAKVSVAGQHDDTVALRFNEVVALMRKPESLMAPAFAVRVFHQARRRPSPRRDAVVDPRVGPNKPPGVIPTQLTGPRRP